VIIDEAGMADTVTLDTAVQFIISRGGSVRLVGDDQQLAAIGAGGVLRDIEITHGALRLTELHRFTDPAEAAATLALRDG
jgi:ATP-dependent exoDNAse (exonuclease V) alpha subunit